MKKYIQILVTVFFMFAIEIVGITSVSLFPQAQAIVGRPLTPVSVAGAGRRTVRRCAVGVYNCNSRKETPTKVVSKNSVQNKG